MGWGGVGPSPSTQQPSPAPTPGHPSVCSSGHRPWVPYSQGALLSWPETPPHKVPRHLASPGLFPLFTSLAHTSSGQEPAPGKGSGRGEQSLA